MPAFSRIMIVAFTFCAAALGWSAIVVIASGGICARTGWLLVVAALCCAVIAFGEYHTRYVGR